MQIVVFRMSAFIFFVPKTLYIAFLALLTSLSQTPSRSTGRLEPPLDVPLGHCLLYFSSLHLLFQVIICTYEVCSIVADDEGLPFRKINRNKQFNIASVDKSRSTSKRTALVVRQVIRQIQLFSDDLLTFTLNGLKYSTSVFLNGLLKSILTSGRSTIMGVFIFLISFF